MFGLLVLINSVSIFMLQKFFNHISIQKILFKIKKENFNISLLQY